MEEETPWYDNPNILFDKEKVFQFWPSRGQSEGERINKRHQICGVWSCPSLSP